VKLSIIKRKGLENATTKVGSSLFNIAVEKLRKKIKRTGERSSMCQGSGV